MKATSKIFWRNPGQEEEWNFCSNFKDCYNQPSLQISNKLSKCHTQAVSAEAEHTVWYNNSQRQEEKALKDGGNLEIMFNQPQQLGSNRTTSIQYGSGTYWLVFYFLYSSISSRNHSLDLFSWKVRQFCTNLRKTLLDAGALKKTTYDLNCRIVANCGNGWKVLSCKGSNLVEFINATQSCGTKS